MKYKKLFIIILALSIISGIEITRCNALNTSETKEIVQNVTAPKPAAVWKCGSILTEQEVSKAGVDSFFKIETISDALFSRMQTGGSYPKNCTIRRTDLRYLQMLHYNYNGQIVCGEMVCNKAIAEDIKEVFKELFKNKYQIERMVLIDDYEAIDDKSMKANNTSCFCFRTVAGSKTLSYHARGLAVDVNPLHNPLVKRNAAGKIIKLQPNTDVARQYANRASGLPHIIDHNDLCYKIFIKHGFSWGGGWKHSKDFQHFEKRL